MRALNLTLYRPLSAADLLPWLLLAATLLAGLALGQRYLEQTEQAAQLRQRIARSIERAKPLPVPALSSQEQKEYRKLQRLVAELDQWPLAALDKLAAIEQPKTALLAVELSGTVTQLTVETRDLTALFEYWLQLQLLPDAARVTLLQHSQHAQSNYSTARGVFRVQWRSAAAAS